MNEKENTEKTQQETATQLKQPQRYTYNDKKETPKIRESEAESRPKKHRQQKRER
jgi:hypothetical protein